MKTSTLFRCGWLLLGVLALAVSARAKEPAEVPGTLKVQVNVPPSWNLLLDDRVSEAFVDRVREVFSRRGFDQPVEELRYVEAPEKVPYLLTINLTDWRITGFACGELTTGRWITAQWCRSAILLQRDGRGKQ